MEKNSALFFFPCLELNNWNFSCPCVENIYIVIEEFTEEEVLICHYLVNSHINSTFAQSFKFPTFENVLITFFVLCAIQGKNKLSLD